MAGRGLVSGSRRNVVPKGGWSEAELWRSLPTTLCPPIERKKPTLLGRLLCVLRTGIEPHMIISKLHYLQAVLQAVAEDFVKSAFIVRLAFQKAVLQEIECSRWPFQMKRRFYQDAFLHLHEQLSQHRLPPWQFLHFPSNLEDYVPC